MPPATGAGVGPRRYDRRLLSGPLTAGRAPRTGAHLVVAVLVALVVQATAWAPGATATLAARAATACPGANTVPSASDIAAAQSATLCLINRERRRRGLRRLRVSYALTRAAAEHSAEMLARNYFSDRSPSGATVAQRVRQDGYHAPRRRTIVGEDIATAGGSLATPRQVVGAWMNSPEHRARLLQRSYRLTGIGITTGMPRSSAQGWRGPAATYTDDFGA
jgi:uncharacterized protein YkwD